MRATFDPFRLLLISIAGLKSAQLLSDFSSIAYSMGNLQRACDAHSKADMLCARAVKRLTTPELDMGTADRVKSMLDGVREVLAIQPISVKFSRLLRASG
jgi:hypothetical protein